MASKKSGGAIATKKKPTASLKAPAKRAAKPAPVKKSPPKAAAPVSKPNKAPAKKGGRNQVRVFEMPDAVTAV